MPHKRILPPLGHRIVKTSAAVLICFIINYFLRLYGYVGSPSVCAVAAIICMRPYVNDTRTQAVERVLGTIIGSFWGFVYLVLMELVPILGRNMIIAYAVMSLGVMIALYSTVILKKTYTAVLTAVVFLSIVSPYPDIVDPLTQSLDRLIDTVIGTLVAMAVNASHLPREKHPEKLFFVRTMDLVPDRYAQIPSSVHITLDYLYNDGAKICLISRWAPAFIISQMGLLNVNAPVIVMDGAAIYDISENKYVDVFPIAQEHAQRLFDIFASFGAGCNVYTVEDNSMLIYHHGPVSLAEQSEYEKMKRSPYRNYMEGSCRETDTIAVIRTVDTTERIVELAYLVRSVLPPGMFRMDIRQEPTDPAFSGIYFYAPEANAANAKKVVLRLAQEKLGTELEPVDVEPRLDRYLPEHDAMLLLNRLKNIYEPVKFFRKS